jgi:hypothetical protein
MEANLVPDSAPLASKSPFIHFSIHANQCGSISTHFSLELGKLQPSAIELEYVYRFGRIGLCVGRRCCLDVRRMFSLEAFSAGMVYRRGAVSTLQFLHFQTKLASPLLPLTSFISYALMRMDLGIGIQVCSYKAGRGNEVGVRLAA